MHHKTEPTAAALASDLTDAAAQFATTHPGLAKAILRPVDLLRTAPPTTGGFTWLAAHGYEHAVAPAEFYATSRSGTRRATNR